MSSQTDTITKNYHTAVIPAGRDAPPMGNASTLLQRLSERDQTAVAECLDAYGAFVWTLAKKNMRSTEEAEKVSEEIFTDIWSFATTAGANDAECPDADTVRRLAVRRIIKYRWESRNIF